MGGEVSVVGEVSVTHNRGVHLTNSKLMDTALQSHRWTDKQTVTPIIIHSYVRCSLF